MANDEFKIAGTASARLEAVQLFRMVGQDGQSVESLRALIRPSADSCAAIVRYRATILHFFDEYVRAGRVLGKRPLRRRRTSRTRQVNQR